MLRTELEVGWINDYTTKGNGWTLVHIGTGQGGVLFMLFGLGIFIGRKS